MTLEECYNKIGANYRDLVIRLGSEDFALLFAKKFLTDDSFINLKTAIAEKNAEKAFRAAHTLKGVVQNLSLDNLYRPSYNLTESLRGLKIKSDCEHLYANVEEEYNRTIELLKQVA